MNFYAQNGEDSWLDANWGTLGLPDVGTFVEVGAGDGVNISNTLWLEKERGWGGLLIEADYRHFPSLVARRKCCHIAHRAIGSFQRPFIIHPHDAELSGFRRDGEEAAYVRVSGLTETLDDYRIDEVNVLSIDTEGTELEVWDTLDLTRFRPQVVFMEWDTAYLNDDKVGVLAAIIKRMTADGYKHEAILGCNAVFTRNEK